MTDHTPDYRTVGEHFLDFTITFFNLAKSKYQQQNQIKANSVGFQALILLKPDRPQRPYHVGTGGTAGNHQAAADQTGQ